MTSSLTCQRWTFVRGAIELLMRTYRDELPAMGGFLTSGSNVRLM